MTLGEFFHMGGYAFYVWTSYAITSLVLLANVVTAVSRGRKLRRDLNRKIRLERRRT